MLRFVLRHKLPVAVTLVVALVAGGLTFMLLAHPPGRVIVTVENRSGRRLTEGAYWCRGETGPLRPPLNAVAPQAAVTGTVLEGGEGSVDLDYAIEGLGRRRVTACGYFTFGGDFHSHVIAEADSLRVDREWFEPRGMFAAKHPLR